MNRPFYVNQIVPFIDKGVVKVFTGIRRCGKSHIMGMVRDVLLSRGVAADQIVEANFESKKTDYVKTAELAFLPRENLFGARRREKALPSAGRNPGT